ncbi:DUF952 domain-containing protein [Nostoc sp. UCD121]|nr:DUF952 domain-containing protein [Nostoc sp. UCD120]MBC1275951.1 DUF952 domain-containing protein [Nostoc sp. UCD121]MBC1293453.1 DUF952 domain-containing protein [Nostoc sp. UCD122]MBC1293482.1 DUF952 domain-containing protein [Nostoc sp. UCD122]
MQLVIFDVDSTLTNTYKIDENCFVRALALEFGIFGINTNWTEYRYTTDSGITQQIFQEKLERLPLSEELVRLKARFVSLLQEAFINNQDLFNEIPGAANILASLQLNPDWGVAIATGGWRESAKLKLQKANLEIEGIPLASANDALSREDIIKTAIIKAEKFYQVEKFQKVVFVGDGVWDVKAAYGLSIAFIGIGDKKLTSVGATRVIKDFTNFEDFLKILQDAAIPRLSMNTILHITKRQQWEQAKNLGTYRADSLESEGFIHCSKSTQILKVAKRFFNSQKDLVLLFIDSEKAEAEIRYEEAEIGELFPHIYGELNIDAVYQVVDFEAAEDGLFELPQEVIDLEE